MTDIFEHGPGWGPISRRAIERLHEVDPLIESLQVKEKFGGLRIYLQLTRSTSDEIQAIDQIVLDAEDEASVTCAECDHVGDDGYTRVPAEGYWYRTLVTSVRLRWR